MFSKVLHGAPDHQGLHQGGWGGANDRGGRAQVSHRAKTSHPAGSVEGRGGLGPGLSPLEYSGGPRSGGVLMGWLETGSPDCFVVHDVMEILGILLNR